MEFCKKCGKVLLPKKEGNKTKLVCPSCGQKKSATGGYTTSEKQEVGTDIVVMGEEEHLPITKEECPECGNRDAYYWIEQTRAADEAPTRFYRCTKCRHTWREYS